MEEKLYRTLVYYRNDDLLQQIEKAMSDRKISKCFLCLVYALFGKTSKAEDIINSLNPESQDMYCLEAKMLIAAAHRSRSNARILAYQILAEYPHAAFARYFLARDTLAPKTLLQSLEHYRRLLEDYPNHDEILLGTAEVLTYSRKYSEAMKYVQQAKPTLRQRLYVVLISTIGHWAILLLGVIVLSLLLGRLAIYVWGTSIIAIAMTIFFIARGKKEKDNFILTAFVYIALLVIIAWLLSQWIWSW